MTDPIPKIVCKLCRSKVPPENVDAEAGYARCVGGQARLRLPGFSRPAPPSAGRPGKRRVALPERFRIWETPARLVIRQRWSWDAVWVLAPLAAAVSGLAWHFWSKADTGRLISLALTAPVGLALTYITLCMLLSATEISVADGRLRVRHGPLPWPGARDLPAVDIVQLYCRAGDREVFGHR